MKIPGRNDPQANVFELVKKWLRNEKKGKWLLVLDNLDNDAVLDLPPGAASPANLPNTSDQPRSLLDYLPQTQNGAVLITTRTKSVAHKLVEPRDTIPIDPMTEADAIELLAKKLDSSPDDTDLRKLAAVLEYMPLAIVQAAAYIQKRAPRCSVRRYIDDFSNSDQAKTSLLNHEAGHLRRDREARNSIIITWQISFDYIREQSPSSADLLSLMSFFDRQGIPEYVLRAQSQTQGENVEAQPGENNPSIISDTGAFEMDLDRLREYSFVLVEADGHTFAMHRLVQLATRTWVVQHEQDTKHRALFLRKLNASLPTGEHKNWTRCEALFPHVKAAEGQQPDHSKADKSVRDWAIILRKAGWYAWARGDYKEAERMCDGSVKALEAVAANDNVTLSYSRGMLATVYRDQGRWREAEELEVQSIEIRKRVLGPEHPATLTSMNNLASTYRERGRWTEAEELLVQVIEIKKRVQGPEHPDMLTSMSNLAATYREQGRWTEAEELLVQVIEIQKRVLGPEHPGTLTCISTLASTFSLQKRWREAEVLEAQVLETRKKMLGQGHPGTLSSMYNLALTFKHQQRDDEARVLMESCQQLYVKRLGPTHRRTQMVSAMLMEWQGYTVQQGQDSVHGISGTEAE